MNQPPTLSSLADLYASLGLHPTESELAAALTSLRFGLVASRALDDIVPKESEPLPSMFPPTIDQPGTAW